MALDVTYKWEKWSYWGAGNGGTVHCGDWVAHIWESDVNTSNNTSVINVHFYVIRTGSGKSQTYNLTTNNWAQIKINDTQLHYQKPAKFDIRTSVASGTVYNLGTVSKRITHDGNGNASVHVYCQHYCGNTTPDYVTFDKWVSLSNTKPAPAPAPPPPPPPPPEPVYLYVDSLWFDYEDLEENQRWFTGIPVIARVKVVCSRGVSQIEYTISGANSGYGIWSTSYTDTSWYMVGDMVKNAGTSTVSVRVKDTSGAWSAWKSATITLTAKPVVYLQVDSVSRTESGSIYAGITRPGFRIQSTATHGIKQAEYKFTGANSATGYVYKTTSPMDFWPLVFDKVGSTTLSVRIQDNEGHWSGWKSMGFTVEEEPHRLSITNLSDQNNSVAIGLNCFKVNCSWDNTHSISYVKFTISGANNFSATITNPTGQSYTWTTGIPYNIGSNTIQVEIKDAKGKVVTRSIKVNTVYPDNGLSVNASYNTAQCNLIKGVFFKDHSNLSLNIAIEHLFRLKSLTVNVFNKTHEVSINENTTMVTWNYGKITQSGTFTITITARDVYDKVATKQISLESLILIQPPSVPQIEYLTPEEKLFLSEGHKARFTGTSTNIKDYKIICAYQNCDVAKATSYCDAYPMSYISSDKTQLRTSLLNNLTGNISYAVYKDFDETHAGIHIKGNDKKTFYLYPESTDTEGTDYYALQWSNTFKPGGLVAFYIIERRQGNFEMLYSTDKQWDAIPLNELFKMCVIPPAPCSLQIRKKIQTSDKLIIEYNNPTKKVASAGNTPIHLVDICMIVKNQQGEVINKTNDKKRDVNNGKQWMYYTKRFYHYVTPKAPEVYELEIDIASYPTGSTISLIAFYYADWFTNPSIYSTSNILNTNKQNVAMRLTIDRPNDNSEVDSLNPNIGVTVHNTGAIEGKDTYLFETNNNWKSNYTTSDGVYYKVPRSKDFHMPNFKDEDLYKPNNILDTVTQQTNITKELSLYNAGTVNNNTIFGKLLIKQSYLSSKYIYTETDPMNSMMWWSWEKQINFDDIQEISVYIENSYPHNTTMYVAKTQSLDNNGYGYNKSNDFIQNHSVILSSEKKVIPQGSGYLTFNLSNMTGKGYLTFYFHRYEPSSYLDEVLIFKNIKVKVKENNTVNATQPLQNIEYFNAHKKIYKDKTLFETIVPTEPVFNEHQVYLQINNSNIVNLGPVAVDDLIEKQKVIFNFTNIQGSLLSPGENKIEAFTRPIIYGESDVDYEELYGTWLTNELYESASIMDGIPWPLQMGDASIILPTDYSWDDVERNVLRILIPYNLLKPSTKYYFDFKYLVPTGFKFTDRVYNHNNLIQICQSLVQVEINNNGVIRNENYVVYSPKVKITGTDTLLCDSVDLYNKWISERITITTPASFEEMNKNNIEILFGGRGISNLKIKDISFVSSTGTIIETDKGKVDNEKKEHSTSITVFYNKFDMEFNYINPIMVSNIIDLRNKLLSIAKRYEINNVQPQWRDLEVSKDFMKARDFNDIKTYCKKLFTEINMKYGICDPSLFDKIDDVIAKETKRGLKDFTASRGKHYFYEWDDLIDALKLQDLKDETIEVIESTECATLSTVDDRLIRLNKPVYLFTDSKGEVEDDYVVPDVPSSTTTTGKIEKIELWDCGFLQAYNAGKLHPNITWVADLSVIAAKVHISGNATQYVVSMHIPVKGVVSGNVVGKPNPLLATTFYDSKGSSFDRTGRHSIYFELCDANGKKLDSKTITIEIASNHKYYPPVGSCVPMRYYDSTGRKLVKVYTQGHTFFRELDLPIGRAVLYYKGQVWDHEDGHTFDSTYTTYYENIENEDYFSGTISDGITTINI